MGNCWIDVNIVDNKLDVSIIDNKLDVSIVDNKLDVNIIDNKLDVNIVDNIININVCDVVEVPMSWGLKNSDYVEATFTSYEWTAPIGSAEDEAVWRITRDVSNLAGISATTTVFENVKRTDRYIL